MLSNDTTATQPILTRQTTGLLRGLLDPTSQTKPGQTKRTTINDDAVPHFLYSPSTFLLFFCSIVTAPPVGSAYVLHLGCSFPGFTWTQTFCETFMKNNWVKNLFCGGRLNSLTQITLNKLFSFTEIKYFKWTLNQRQIPGYEDGCQQRLTHTSSCLVINVSRVCLKVATHTILFKRWTQSIFYFPTFYYEMLKKKLLSFYQKFLKKQKVNKNKWMKINWSEEVT